MARTKKMANILKIKNITEEDIAKWSPEAQALYRQHEAKRKKEREAKKKALTKQVQTDEQK